VKKFKILKKNKFRFLKKKFRVLKNIFQFLKKKIWQIFLAYVTPGVLKGSLKKISPFGSAV